MLSMKRRLAASIERHYQEYLEKGFPADEAYRLAEVDAYDDYSAACEARMDARREERYDP